jgi:subtilisin-like proprotein convertase family protein
MQVGDQIQYIVTARDASLESNTSQSGPHSFVVVQGRGTLLLLVDEGDPKASGTKHGGDKRVLPEAPADKGLSGQLLADDLRAAGFVVQTGTPGASDPVEWTGYDLLVYACGSATSPAADADFRDALRAWVAGGGKLLVEGGEIGYDASSNPGYPSFAREVLHVARWESDEAGPLAATAGSATHPLRLSPHALPSEIALQSNLLFGDLDSMAPSTDAQLIYGSVDAPDNAGVLVYDDNTHPGSAQIVYWAFAYAKLLDPQLAAHLADNSVSYLLAPEPEPSARLAGVVSLKDGGPAADLELRLTPSGITTTTDGSGAFELTPLYAGSYLLEVAGPPGYETARRSLQLAEGEDRDDLTIVLRAVTEYSICDEQASAIPDGDMQGLLRELDPAGGGEVVGIHLQIEIQHPWRGDLFVELTSPEGTTVVLHNRSGSDLDDLNLVYPDSSEAEGPGSMADFLGELAEGSWWLRVADQGAGDTGSFVRACLTLETAEPIDVPVLASALRATSSEAGVRLVWEVNAGTHGSFDLLRAVDGGLWERRNPEPIPASEGRLEFVDGVSGLRPSARLEYRLRWASEDGSQDEILSEYSVTLDEPAPRRFDLAQNHPNPFNPRTTIVFSLPRDAQTALRIYDLQGRLVSTLLNETMSAGEHRVVWDGSDASGHGVAAGTYVYELRSGSRRLTRSMVLLK